VGLYARQQSAGDGLRLAERAEVSAGHQSRLGGEALMRDAVLKLEWEEPVAAPG
jgi:hypothetical protein